MASIDGFSPQYQKNEVNFLQEGKKEKVNESQDSIHNIVKKGSDTNGNGLDIQNNCQIDFENKENDVQLALDLFNLDENAAPEDNYDLNLSSFVDSDDDADVSNISSSDNENANIVSISEFLNAFMMKTATE